MNAVHEDDPRVLSAALAVESDISKASPRSKARARDPLGDFTRGSSRFSSLARS